MIWAALLTGISDSIKNRLKASKSSVNPLPERAQGTGSVSVPACAVLTERTLACKKTFMLEKIELLPGSLDGIMGFSSRKFKAFFKVKVNIKLTFDPTQGLDHVNVFYLPWLLQAQSHLE
jgi:hypothetical protein